MKENASNKHDTKEQATAKGAAYAAARKSLFAHLQQAAADAGPAHARYDLSLFGPVARFIWSSPDGYLSSAESIPVPLSEQERTLADKLDSVQAEGVPCHFMSGKDKDDWNRREWNVKTGMIGVFRSQTSEVPFFVGLVVQVKAEDEPSGGRRVTAQLKKQFPDLTSHLNDDDSLVVWSYGNQFSTTDPAQSTSIKSTHKPTWKLHLTTDQVNDLTTDANSRKKQKPANNNHKKLKNLITNDNLNDDGSFTLDQYGQQGDADYFPVLTLASVESLVEYGDQSKILTKQYTLRDAVLKTIHKNPNVNWWRHPQLEESHPPPKPVAPHSD